ncbi:hypothetical protein HMPREF9718_01191 [Sphingobium yanoikuyae ATCC 51230]|uniref:Uncharacterized protein n=1 Tax=Sphingobium yanoikuyae ATCC 51230 TaxID=883163 RepID=K9CUF3_SPHYA|nr:hypothetical protein HMPREF9718_01191 [Sphingobium yanoikuyae ATCC 51230]
MSEMDSLIQLKFIKRLGTSMWRSYIMTTLAQTECVEVCLEQVLTN